MTTVTTLLLADNFTRVDNPTSIGATDGAGSLDPQTWAIPHGQFGILSNQAYRTANITNYNVAAVEMGVSDMDVSITLADLTNSNGSAMGLAVRIIDQSQFYFLMLDRSGGATYSWYVGKLVAGVETYLAASPYLTPAAADGDVVRIRAVGSQLDFYINGVLFASFSDSSFTGTKAGFFALNVTSGGMFDAFSASSVTTVTPATAAAPSGVTAAEILDLPLNIGQVRSTVEWDILDQNLEFLFKVNPITDTVPSVAVNSTATIKRTLSGLYLDPFDQDRINVLTMRIRPYWVLEDALTTRFPLGVFLFSDATRNRTTAGLDLKGTLYDQTVIVNQGLARTYSVADDALITDALLDLAAGVGIAGARIIIEPSDATTYVAIAWRAGTSRYDIMSELATMAGYYPPYFDNDGILRFKLAPSTLVDVPMDHTYNVTPSSRLIDGSLDESDDLINAPNRYLVVSTAATGVEVSGYYDLPASAPQSYANRGYLVVKRIDAQGLKNNAACTKRAQLEAIIDYNSFSWVAFDATPDPRHDIFDTVQYLEENYREVGWTLRLKPGGQHSHRIRKIYT